MKWSDMRTGTWTTVAAVGLLLGVRVCYVDYVQEQCGFFQLLERIGIDRLFAQHQGIDTPHQTVLGLLQTGLQPFKKTGFRRHFLHCRFLN
jgi:hypothetical protein